MQPDRNPLHYTPSSVGGLMDTAFLRGAAIHASGAPELSARSPSPLLARVRKALSDLSRRAGVSQRGR